MEGTGHWIYIKYYLSRGKLTMWWCQVAERAITSEHPQVAERAITSEHPLLERDWSSGESESESSSGNNDDNNENTVSKVKLSSAG